MSDDSCAGVRERFETIESRLEYGGITYEIDKVQPICPHDGKRDSYTVEIEIQPHDGVVPEVYSFREWVRSYSGREIWHEDLVQELKERLKDALNTEGGYVRVSGKHEDVQATVEVSW